jgi:hypothetical protein
VGVYVAIRDGSRCDDKQLALVPNDRQRPRPVQRRLGLPHAADHLDRLCLLRGGHPGERRRLVPGLRSPRLSPPPLEDDAPDPSPAGVTVSREHLAQLGTPVRELLGCRDRTGQPRARSPCHQRSPMGTAGHHRRDCRQAKRAYHVEINTLRNRPRPRSWCRKRSPSGSGLILCGDRRGDGFGGVGGRVAIDESESGLGE